MRCDIDWPLEGSLRVAETYPLGQIFRLLLRQMGFALELARTT